MTTKQLLAELESLTHSQRVKRMLQLGRASAGTSDGRAADQSRAAVLKSLQSGSSYERRLALYAALGSRDGVAVAASISDASALVRNLAGHLAPMLCDDASVVQVLHAADRNRRLQIVRGLRKRGRRNAVDSLLDAAIARGERHWTDLLAFASAACAARHAKAFSGEAPAEHWRRLARHHPLICAELLTGLAREAQDLDARLRANARAVLPMLGNRVPGATLALVRSLARYVPMGELSLDTLARHRPNEVARELLDAEPSGQLRFTGAAYRLDAPLRLAMLVRDPQSLPQPQRWLLRLPREQRLIAYETCALAWRDREGMLSPALMSALPEAQRQHEGQRHLELPALATRPTALLAFAAFLSWSEMRRAVDPLLRDADAEIRGAALASFVAAARFHPDHLSEVLELLSSRKNEQNPVRILMLTALAALPPGRWKAEHLESLGMILRQALDAADASDATASAAEALVVRLIPFGNHWARQWLGVIVAERGRLMSPLLQRLSDTDVIQLAPILLPVLQSWQTREREGYILGASRYLGRRLRVFDGLANILESLARSSADNSTAEMALRILADERRDRFKTIVPELIKADPTWAMRPIVYEYLHRHRQDLLEPCLGRVAYRGRFSTGQTRSFLSIADGYWRWTPAQQARLALTLAEVTQDTQRDNPAVFGVISQWAAMPDVEPTRLIELANLDKSRLAIRDTALRALGRLDAARGVPVLLQALGDDRARIAIYSLRHALLQMPSATALATLQNAPMAQVTVAKEVIRLVGELETEAAFVTLLEYDKRDLHRDVRSALLRALWSFLDRDESWEIMSRAVASDEPGQADVVSRIPADTLNADGQRRLAALLAALLAHQDARVRLNVLQRLAALPLNDLRQALLPGLLTAIASALPDESDAAAAALFATYAGRQAELVGQAATKMLPNRRAINTLVESLCVTLTYRRVGLLNTARAVLSALSADALTIRLRARLALWALPTDEIAAFFREAAAAGTLHSDALATAISTLSQTAAVRGPASMEPVEKSLSQSPDERLRRIALAALTAATERNQAWSEDQMSRLIRYRQDTSPLVAGAAQFTFPAGLKE